MKPMAFEADGRQLRIGYGDTGRVGPAVEFRADMQAGAAVRRADQADDGRGVPRQFIAICENRRCSILFHLLVPGGK